MTSFLVGFATLPPTRLLRTRPGAARGNGYDPASIPHHQGAIDMARVVLQYGKDEKVKSWANDVIREQQHEIGEMEEWLKKHGK